MLLGQIKVLPSGDTADKCLVIRTTPLTRGEARAREFNLSVERMQAALFRWRSGALLQHVFPGFTQSEREFIKSGLWDSAWDEIFTDESDEQVVIEDDDDPASCIVDIQETLGGDG